MVSSNLMLYNKSRDTDRICPSCRRWYQVGEAERSCKSFGEFLQRDPASTTEIGNEQRDEQNQVDEFERPNETLGEFLQRSFASTTGMVD